MRIVKKKNTFPLEFLWPHCGEICITLRQDEKSSWYDATLSYHIFTAIRRENEEEKQVGRFWYILTPKQFVEL